MTPRPSFPRSPLGGATAMSRFCFSCPTWPCGDANDSCQGGGPWAVGMHKGAERLEIRVGSGGGSY